MRVLGSFLVAVALLLVLAGFTFAGGPPPKSKHRSCQCHRTPVRHVVKHVRDHRPRLFHWHR